jgi:tryptophanyl-tRNA synthetase
MSLRDPLKKMSKSDKDTKSSTLFLTDSPDVIRQKINRAVTDSLPGITFDRQRRPGLCNLIEIMAGISDRTPQQVEEAYRDKMGVMCTGQFKQELTELLIEHLTPIQREMVRLNSKEGGLVDAILASGAKEANQIAEENYQRISRAVGIY